RFWARKLTGVGLGLDDWLALASLCVVIAEFCYGISSPLVKLSLLAFYWRVFPTSFMRKGIYALSTACLGWLVAIFITNCLQCRPLSYTWEQTVTPGAGTCIDLVLYFVGNSVANSLIDVFTLVLPIRETMRLQVSSSRRLGICCVFALGSLVVIASLVRFGSLASLYAAGVTDMTKQYALMWTATVVEIYIAVIGACAVTLVPVYRKMRYGTPWSTEDQKSRQISSGSGGFPASSGGRGAHNFKRPQNHHERLDTNNDSEEYLHYGSGMKNSVSGTTRASDAGGASGEDLRMDTIVVQKDVTWEE
ncbi:hypothetical protein LY76DRAFT_482678, partial [Colletotrichum caudatum]